MSSSQVIDPITIGPIMTRSDTNSPSLGTYTIGNIENWYRWFGLELSFIIWMFYPGKKSSQTWYQNLFGKWNICGKMAVVGS